MKHLKPFVAALLVPFCLGCASVHIQKVDPGGNTAGLRFYKPTPFLLVAETRNDKDEVSLTHEILWLPDYSEAYVVRPSGILGSSKLDVELRDGWMLTKLGAERDTQSDEMVTALTGLVGKVQERGVVQGKVADGSIRPGLYRFVYENGRFKELERIAPK